MEPKWLDAPFFTLVEDFSSLQTYFLAQAMFIAKIVLTLNIGFMAIKYVAKGQGLSEQLIKVLSSLIIFLIVINSYPLMIQGINRIIYAWSYGSTYGKVAEMIQKTTSSGEATEFWEKKANDPDAYSDIIKTLETETGKGNVGKKYVLDIFDKGTAKRPGMFIRPNAVMRLLMLSFETIWNKALTCLEPRGALPFPRDTGGAVILILTAIAVVLCGILASLQYFICALEFTLITSVGCLLLPFMLWDGSKFLTEKLVGAIVGFSIKMLFVTIALMLTINGYLALMVRPFDSFIDQAIYTVFVSLFYMMICQNGPALAVSLLTGSPQMSLMEGVAAAGTFAAAGVAGAAGAKAAASGAAKTAVRAKSAGDKAAGAAKAAFGDTKGQTMGSRIAAAAGAGARSIGDSAKESVKSGVHGLAQSLTKGKGGGGGAGGGASGGKNRWSTLEARNTPKDDGNRKTSKEFGQENRAKGAERYAGYKAEAQAKAQADWKAGLQNKPKPAESQKRYDGGTPLGSGSTGNRVPSIQKNKSSNKDPSPPKPT